MAHDPRSFSPVTVEAAHKQDGGEIDIEAIAEDLEAEGRHQGLGHRADPAPSDREHGRKTRAHSKDIISGRA